MKKTEIHDSVSKAYTAALSKAEESCCGSNDGARGVTAETAGYDDTQGVTSFGCGNPLAFSEVAEGDTVVDLGSGAGLDLLIAAEKVGPSGRVIGVDMTDDMIARARRNALDAGATQVEVRKGLIEDLPVRNCQADWIISNCVINLSPNKPAVFKEIVRTLKPGGRFRISDVVAEGLPDWITENEAAFAACVAGAISASDYVAGLEAAGLTDVSIEETVTYTADQLKAMVASDLANLGMDPSMMTGQFEEIVGRVKSVKVVGRKSEVEVAGCCS
jgi:arsenite methyltransferase